MRRLFPALALLIMLVGGTAPAGHPKGLSFDGPPKIIVLDPGHGGGDNGVKGRDGTLEKTITLTLARMIARELKTRHKVVLTRTDDYSIDIPSRSALANHLKADIFLSLHTGGSFLPQTGGTYLFYFKNPSEPASSLEITAPGAPEGAGHTIPWNKLQERHSESSKRLAETIKSRLIEQIASFEYKVGPAPLLVLSGVDTPAVLIELGHLTNPAEEKKLSDPAVLSDFSSTISRAIMDFFRNDQ